MKSTGEIAVSSLAGSILWRTTLVLFVTLFVFNSLALANNWYHQVPVIDIPAHLVFGALLATIFYLCRKRKLDAWRGLVLVVCFTLAVGVFWELLEFLRDTYIAVPYGWSFAQTGTLDTVTDLVNNTVGGVAVSFLRMFDRHS